jgi:peptidyl-prolyl cis-trans isomerase C
MDEKNQDPGMKNNEKGYAVAAGMTNFDSAFVDAAMALAKPGDISDKVRGTSYGYYIIRYESDEAEGATPLDDVKETISSALLSTKQNEVYNTTVNQWVEEAGIKVDLNALKD